MNESRTTAASRPPLRGRQRGWGASEYFAVLAGLVVVWRGAELVLAMIHEHHDKFSWALMIPY